MNRQRTTALTIVLLAAGLVGFSMAGGGQPRSQSPVRVVGETGGQFSAEEIEGFRTEFREVMTFYYDWAVLSEHDLIQSLAAEGMAAIDQLPYEHLDLLMSTGVDVSRLHSAVEDLYVHVVARMAEQTATGPDCSGADPGFPSAPYTAGIDLTFLGIDFQFGPVNDVRPPALLLLIALETVVAAQGVWHGLDRVCTLDVGGFNCSICCIVGDILLTISVAIDEFILFLNDDIDSAEIKGTYDRVCALHLQIGENEDALQELQKTVNAIDMKVDLLAAAVEGLRTANCEIIRLLHTPQGSRQSDLATCDDQPGWPYDWPE